MKPIATTATAFGPFSVYAGIPSAFRTGDATDILNGLEGPAAFILDWGCENTRLVSFLTHGNEDSGLKAVARAFAEENAASIYANMVYFVGHVQAAKAGEDYFSHRLIDLPRLPKNLRDMNRIWSADQPLSVLALRKSLFDLLEGRNLEAVIDLHNTSGQNPAHGIVVPDAEKSLRLAGALIGLGVKKPLYGHLVGALTTYAPSVLVECGKLGLSESESITWEILQKFLQSDLAEMSLPNRVYEELTDVWVDPQVEIEFALASLKDDTLALRLDLEHYNFETLDEDTPIGHYTGPSFPLSVEKSLSWRDYFVWDEKTGDIYVKEGQTISMATLNEENIRDSCLFSLIRETH